MKDAQKEIKFEGVGSEARTYSHAVCISYTVRTGNVPVVYQGELDDQKDMQERVRKMRTAINVATQSVLPADKADIKTLKIFMAPEFYFRGRYGAYPPDIVSKIMDLLSKDNYGVKNFNFKDWMFVFGTAISATIDGRLYCFTCKSDQHLDFKMRDPKNPARTIPKCTKGASHKIKEKIYGAVIDNVALIRKGTEDYLVAKEFISQIDFRNYQVEMKDGGTRKTFNTIATEGSRDKRSQISSRFTDERMGGGIFNIDGVTFGAEICLDHSKEKLKSVGNIQILLVPSAGMRIKTMRTIADGISFNVDGLRPGSEVKILDKGVLTVQTPKFTKPMGIGGKIEVYEKMRIPYL